MHLRYSSVETVWHLMIDACAAGLTCLENTATKQNWKFSQAMSGGIAVGLHLQTRHSCAESPQLPSPSVKLQMSAVIAGFTPLSHGRSCQAASEVSHTAQRGGGHIL